MLNKASWVNDPSALRFGQWFISLKQPQVCEKIGKPENPDGNYFC